MKSRNKINNAFISILSRPFKCNRVIFAAEPGPLTGGMRLESSSMMTFLLEGNQQISYYKGGKRVNYIMSGGEIFFAPVGHPYISSWVYDCKRIGIVAGEFKRLSLSWHNHVSSRPRVVDRPDLWYSVALREETDLFSLFSAMIGRIAMPADSPVSCALAELIIKRMIEHFETEQHSEPERTAYHTYQRISSYLEANCHHQVSRKELAANFGLHPDYVTRLFKEFANCGFSEYLLKLRMLSAEWYLRNSEMPIHEIAGTCGFYDTSYFIKIFRAGYSLSPGEYRRKMLLGVVPILRQSK